MKNKLIAIRRLHNERQKDVAAKIGTSIGDYSRYESGKMNMSVPTMKKFCVAYDVSADWLLGFTGKTTWQSNEEILGQIDHARNEAVHALEILDNLQGGQHEHL